MSVKVVIAGTMLLVSLVSFSQDVVKDSSKLVSMVKMECSWSGLGVNYEVPLGKYVTLDNGVGITAGVQVLNERMHYEYKITNPSIYVKTELKYYYNRYIRVAKKLPTSWGQGSYFAWQNKFNTQRIIDDKQKLSNVLMCEAHWGFQRLLWKKIIFNAHIGLGRAFDFTSKGSSNYMAMGLKVAYRIGK